ncbi:MAG: molybdopterin-synthase adenylyltransferase MoeB [Gemmatimonadetes bacterium]|nr:molybdopterin-synthase adenylyltransferase MoeB [Gemmatimonadota bacterium]MCY3943416.1 molybdopterin-synthase adenylyltransferase MoeB [Gemmatimonadota bacterium]
MTARREGLTRREATRYARHLVLPEVGRDGQERLKEARVLIVGLGGLGSPAALYLAAAGVGTLGIVDADSVELSNLQRQILYGTGDLGSPKVDAALARLRDANPHVALQTEGVRMTSENALRIVEEYDVVVDGSDNFPTRYLVNDACVLTGRADVYGAVHRWEGQLAVFAAEGGPCYRCLFREPPPPGMVPSCAEAGVFGALPGVIGAAQAMEAIKLLLGVGRPLVGRLQIFDALRSRWREIEVRRDPGCAVCGDRPTQTGLIDYELFCGSSAGGHRQGEGTIGIVEPEELAAVLATEPRPLLLDVREPAEWDALNLADLGAVLMPLGELPGRLDEIPPARPIVIYCHSGARSLQAAEALVEWGCADVRTLEGGIAAQHGMHARSRTR